MTDTPPRWHTHPPHLGGGIALASAAAAIAGVTASVALGRFAYRNTATFERVRAAVKRAGFVEKTVDVDGVVLNYAEGPPAPGAPPLLLLHGQASDWKSYGKALTELAGDFHVIAVDIPGHGGSDRTPGRYTANDIGALLSRFLEMLDLRGVIVSGHSSGGQLAAWLGANCPERIAAVHLEDPPMFTTLPDRAPRTWNFVDLATACHGFLADHPGGEGDFVAYYWEHQYVWKYFGGGADRMRRAGLKLHAKHPDRPLAPWWMPGADLRRSLMTYDPRFGDAFYTGAWDTGFDHEATLRAITQPSTYLHSKVDYDGEILRGAADDDDAARITSLLPDTDFIQTSTGHDIHNEATGLFVQSLRALADRSRPGPAGPSGH